ncbi:MAG: hypothetical protein D6752_07050 [Candidatus Nitrosothermus koennekii]|nr:MAG: hypothetical protein D6752_07050 [Candidatus Nitrosothermus koennekii]
MFRRIAMTKYDLFHMIKEKVEQVQEEIRKPDVNIPDIILSSVSYEEKYINRRDFVEKEDKVEFRKILRIRLQLSYNPDKIYPYSKDYLAGMISVMLESKIRHKISSKTLIIVEV